MFIIELDLKGVLVQFAFSDLSFFLILQNQLYAQTVLGVDDTGETYVVFIYEDPGTGQDVLDNLEHLTVSLYCMRTLAKY